MSWFNWKDAVYVCIMAFTIPFWFNAGDDVYWFLSGLVGICRG